jgi:hypothetical protein
MRVCVFVFVCLGSENSISQQQVASACICTIYLLCVCVVCYFVSYYGPYMHAYCVQKACYVYIHTYTHIQIIEMLIVNAPAHMDEVIKLLPPFPEEQAFAAILIRRNANRDDAWSLTVLSCVRAYTCNAIFVCKP